MSYVKEELDLLTQTRQGKSTEQPLNRGGKHKEVKNKPAIFHSPRGEMDLLCRFRYGTGKDLFTHPHPQKQERKKGPVQSIVGSKEGEKFEVKPPKGTRDFHPHQMAIRRKVIDSVVEVFKKHGGVEIDTPVFELKEVLTGKYGEDSKLIYDLEDQGGQKCSLRYDLTVPFARFMANNTNIQKIKRFHIGKVYRRDQPTITKGRYREFYQCDFDIAGKYDPMIPDAEVLSVMQQILETLGIQDFLVKVNHRKILQSLVAEAGCDPKMFKSICSSIDKLDKLSWEEVKEELIKTKGVSQQSADIIGNLTKHKGNPHQLLKFIMKGNLFNKQLDALQPVLQQMEKLFDYLEALEKNSKVSFDMSLARGLDYYTGLIYQIVLTDKKNELGSISGGGRYDNLIGMFCQYEIPSVGGSIGIQRLFTILEKKYMDKVKQNACEVLVATIGKIPVTQKLKVLNQLWKANIKAETMYIEKGKPDKQINHAFNNGIPLIIWIGETQLQNGEANLKVLYKHEEMKVKLKNIGEELKPHVEMFRKEFELGNVELKNPKKK